MDKKNNFSTRQQTHPHQEGQVNNITPQKEGTDQRVSENKSQAMPDILNDNSEQRSGDSKDDSSERQDER